ncbi:lysine N(6)-hydroxylase/L-ornithine N(5)-oxygenase family protein [Streptomyces sp. SP18CS02]|uniref:lysine N(6)-hydroxylase/L-ornithine N(5)-oxygenase family protein n=1 Tax=Streptomyces sp. SP18CS02 TaxID=3002531 RepID=UPI002E766B52|nr:SidA/IucD/PvdA family monooxygenase [Streptomyces sp. SP18CS02]MEE1753790.1 SidA/IucD/PvdA family monooxygenase [Streptomyces sp. SP18CS02]
MTAGSAAALSTASRGLEGNTPLDALGIGFGPSNLALAIALDEAAGPGPAVQFYERLPRFSWHRGMLLRDATMQVHFLKDLVTMRNPTSRFSFLCYLRDRGRLADFINHKALFPSRLEFHDYLEWCAASVDADVSYGCEVLSVEPVADTDAVRYLDVRLRRTDGDGRSFVRRTRNVVLAPGLRPRLPEGVSESGRVWHSSRLLPRLEDFPDERAPLRFTVVGAGQSAAEVVSHLHGRFPQAQVRAVFSAYGYTPADDSPFANRIFDPPAVDDFYQAPPSVRRMLTDRHRNTNYAVVDADLIEELYGTWYQEKVVNEQRLLIDNASRLLDTEETADGLHLTLETLTTGTKSRVESDYLVYATGYVPTPPEELLAPELVRYCKRDSSGHLRVGRDYRLEMEDGVHCGIYLQGATEYTHGLSSTLLSNTAVRAGEIAHALTGRPPQDA